MAAIASTSRAIYRYPHTYVPFGGEFVLFRETWHCFIKRVTIIPWNASFPSTKEFRIRNFPIVRFGTFSFVSRSIETEREIGSVKCFTTRANTSRLLSWPRPSRISIPKRRKEGRKESRALCLRGMMHRSTNSG